MNGWIIGRHLRCTYFEHFISYVCIYFQMLHITASFMFVALHWLVIATS